MKLLATIFLCISGFIPFAEAQTSFYENLPVGKHPVGFKVVTIDDPTRVEPMYNYIGEKNTGKPERQVTIHLWYPAKASGNTKKMSYEDYIVSQLLTDSKKPVSDDQRAIQSRSRRSSTENWFGKTADENWNKLLSTSMLAVPNAGAPKEKFPVLIGTLRPLSTTVVNELLASHGFIVAMVVQGNFQLSSSNQVMLRTIPDLQTALKYVCDHEQGDVERVGSFGFSGSGFAQVLLAMFDPRIKAVADIESGFYMNDLYQFQKSSDYYQTDLLRVPFLHIFSADLSKEEKYLSDFTVRKKFSKRYRLILTQPKLHHWDFAAEGYAATLLLNNRGDAQNAIRQSFEISATYLVSFFNAELQDNEAGKTFMLSKPTIAGKDPSLWAITTYDALKPAPNAVELENLIDKRGIDEALRTLSTTLPNDSLSTLRDGFALNSLGYKYLGSKKHKEALSLFDTNVTLHPDNANFNDSLAEALEKQGDFDRMKVVAQHVLDLLSKKATLSPSEQAVKRANEKRVQH